MPQTASSGTDAFTSLERRLTGEWDTLLRLAQANPGRLTDLSAEDLTFRLTLRHTAGLRLALQQDALLGNPVTEHGLRIQFPRFFPAAPMELYLDYPVQHPNIHPETGFVCLWDRHRVSNTVESALHKTIAILGWRLYNDQPVHVMQPEALTRMRRSREAIVALLTSAPLIGTASPSFFEPDSERRRVRLS